MTPRVDKHKMGLILTFELNLNLELKITEPQNNWNLNP